MFKNFRLGTSSAFACLTGAMLAPGASAQESAAPATPQADVSYEVLVTAQRRSERQSDVPIAITSIDPDALDQAGIDDLSDIDRVTPGLSFDNATAGYAQPTIRGIGTSFATPGGGANVGIYVDGFYSPNPLAGNFQLLNVESVQVIKGPQGTLFGRNTTGGAILVSTAKPSIEPTARAQVSYGSFNTQSLQAYGSTGITDRIAVEAQGLYRSGDGYVNNVLTGRDAGEYENWNLRLGVRADITEDISVLLRYLRDDTDDRTSSAQGNYTDNGIVYSAASVIPGAVLATRPSQVSFDGKTGFTSQSDTLQLTTTFGLGFATLTSYSQYREDSTRLLLDLDHSSAPIFHLDYPVEDRTITQEFLLTDDTDGPLQWAAGVFYFDYRDTYPRTTASAGGGPYNQIAGSSIDTRSLALYADGTYEARPGLFLTLGARYSHDELTNGYFLSGPSTITVPTERSDHITPRVVVRYEPTEHSSLYASYTRGYKPGLLNVGGGSLSNIDIDSESITAYEVGFKFDTRRLAFDLSTFYYDYTDLQVSSYDGTASLITNAADSRIYGIEGQLRYELAAGLDVSLGAALLDAEYEHFTTSPRYDQCLNAALCGFGDGLFLVSTTDASGNEMLRAPRFAGNIALSYRTQLAGGEVRLSGNLYHTSKFYFDSSNQFSQGAYELLNLRAEWTAPSGRVTVALFGDNVTDTEYRLQADPGVFGIGSIYGYPATVGASVRVNY